MSPGRGRRLFPLLALILGFAAGLGWWLVQGEELLTQVQEVDNAAMVATLDGDGSYQSALAVAETAAAPTAPDAVSLPAITEETANAAEDYLGGAGAPLLQFMEAMEDSWMNLDGQSCEALAARLEEILPPPELVVLADQVPDDPARDTLANLVSFTVRHVAECGGDSSIASEVAWHWAVAARRLAQLGVGIP